MRLQALGASLVFLTASSWAVPASSGAFVENIRFEKQSRIAFVRIVNTSTKDISGVNLSIDVTYLKGPYHYERLLDFAPKFIGQQKKGEEGENDAPPPTHT